MKKVIVLALMLGGTSAASAVPLVRQDREDTIYHLRADRDKLEAFMEDVGSKWTGGIVVNADATDGTITYWAYSKRTAAESRAFILPAMVGRLQLGIDKYDESKWFPAERRKLDRVAVRCGIDADPFFVRPTGSIELVDLDTIDSKTRKCLSEGAQRNVKMPQVSAQTGQR